MKELYYKIINMMYPQIIQPVTIEEQKPDSVLSKVLDNLLLQLKVRNG